MSQFITIGILSLQGCVKPHIPHILALGENVKAIEVKTAEDFEKADAFILPGGESTTMWKNIDNFGLYATMDEHFRKKPVWGICAGAILMARKVLGREQRSFHLAEFDVERNAYGRQVDSHEKIIHDYPVTFIRAPKIKNVDLKSCQILAQNGDDESDPTWLISHSKRYMVTTFHPELTEIYPSPMHKLFFEFLNFNFNS